MKIAQSLRAKLVSSCLLFTLTITTAAVLLISASSRRSLIQSNIQMSSYNLSLIARLISQDISNLETLAKWCSINTDIKAALESDSQSFWLLTYDNIKDIVQNNPSYSRLDRIIIMDKERSRFLQYSPQSSMSKMLTTELVDRNLPQELSVFTSLEESDFIYPGNQVISQLLPITDYNTGEEMGYVYIAISMPALLSNFRDYSPVGHGQLTVRIADTVYTISEGRLEAAEEVGIKDAEPYTEADLLSAECISFKADGRRFYRVSAGSVSDIIILQETFPLSSLFSLSSGTALILVAIVILMLIFTALLVLLLNHLIVTPVKRITTRLQAIGESDFSRDTTIETEDELGQIGKGINELSTNVVTLMQRKIEDEKKKQELEYRMLQSQINPHFLYNTLNAIKWMAVLQKADGIAEMVTSLSRLLKTVAKGKDQIVPLSDEISLAREYVTIMKYRYGSTILFSSDIDESTGNTPIPRFTLQPLLENAIFHGIEPKGEGTVSLSVKREDGKVVIRIEDNGIGFDPGDLPKDGKGGMFKEIGIDNIRRRLEYAFEGRASLEVISHKGEGTCCIITLPSAEEET